MYLVYVCNSQLAPKCINSPFFRGQDATAVSALSRPRYSIVFHGYYGSSGEERNVICDEVEPVRACQNMINEDVHPEVMCIPTLHDKTNEDLNNMLPFVKDRVSLTDCSSLKSVNQSVVLATAGSARALFTSLKPTDTSEIPVFLLSEEDFLHVSTLKRLVVKFELLASIVGGEANRSGIGLPTDLHEADREFLSHVQHPNSREEFPRSNTRSGNDSEPTSMLQHFACHSI